MAKDKHFFGKFLAFTATAAAVGGACYVFRDKIKKSPLYKATLDKAYDLYDKWKERKEEDEDDFEDFSFEEESDDFEDVFTSGDKSNREYTSITINFKEEPEEEPEEQQEEENIENTEATADSDIPMIDFGANTTVNSDPTPDVASSSTSEEAQPEVLGYENEGLSDVSEDPDVLEEQDRLDF